MKLWLDVHIPPALIPWLRSEFAIEAVTFQHMRLREAEDRKIFFLARDADAVIMSKDADFAGLIGQLGSPPKLLWITCGNTSKANLQRILAETLPIALELLARGEAIIEIHERSS